MTPVTACSEGMMRRTTRAVARRARPTRARVVAADTARSIVRPTSAATPRVTTSVVAPVFLTATSGTFTGHPVPTQWGIVQVQITVATGKITSVQTLQHPNDTGHSQDVNAYALPLLQAEAVQANSAHIGAISGATVTSDGYAQSLQSAIDLAHL